SHEIRTPIQTILGMTELLVDTALDKEQMDYIRTVRFSADVLLGLINDILDFSKIEAGKLDLETADFDLRDLLRLAVELIILDAHKKELEVILDIDEALPRVVRGDPGRLRQIVVNLFKNAVKFTRAGEIIVEARLLEKDDGPFLAVNVRDSGAGVQESLKAKLFTPFTQGAAGVMAQGGTGLGLAISRFLVGLMGGAIWYEPNRPRGAVFGFEIPLKSADYSMPPHARHMPYPARVLIVDDHSLALAHSIRVASGFGLIADGAFSGEEALSALKRAAATGKPYAACLIDQNMPGMDGWRLAAEITADKMINATRLVLIAPEGAIGPEAKMKLLQWFNGYAAKPIDPDELYEVLRLALSDEVDLPPADDDSVQSSEAEPAKPVDSPRLGLSILLAEDHLVNQELFKTLLQKLGCEVAVASDGEKALELFSENDYDLILMDIFMPTMDGYQAARELRLRGYSKPIIAVTASAVKGERDKCIAVGMNDVLVKPFKRKDLETMLVFWANKSLAIEEPPQTAAPVSERHLWDASVFDFTALVDTFLGKRSTVIDLLGRFITKTRTQLSEIEASIAASDAKSVREAAHSIKGASWNLSAQALGDAAKELEDASKNGDLDRASGRLKVLSDRMEEFESCAGYYIRLSQDERE
ncbi:MAG TPA: hybrid sensor histidine kinase/response regulator, partial [Spirochaetaceae bacterium]|nr:hybrid sensor histidine kinase/response regulator [Spirochaetaceae bacterium]